MKNDFVRGESCRIPAKHDVKSIFALTEDGLRIMTMTKIIIARNVLISDRFKEKLCT